MKIALLILLVLGIFYRCESNSKYLKDYPNYNLCVVQQYHTLAQKSIDTYEHLAKNLGLQNNCTHIYGSLEISNLAPFPNGTEPDLSFLESIQEISGKLKIFGNSVKKISLPNLKVIRGSTLDKTDFSLEIFKNYDQNTRRQLQELDLSGLRVIQSKGVLINYDGPYLTSHVNWWEIVDQADTAKITISTATNTNTNVQCHDKCNAWSDPVTKQMKKFCFGPNIEQCQPRTKCTRHAGEKLPTKWCRFVPVEDGNAIEQDPVKGIPCDKDCSGGCTGNTNAQCRVCKSFYKKDRCVSSCDSSIATYEYGKPSNQQDDLLYKVAGLCTSHCPASLLEQNHNCQYICDFDNYFKSGNHCWPCPDENCRKIIGGKQSCQIKDLMDNYKDDGSFNRLDLKTLQQLTNCTTIIGPLKIDKISFDIFNITESDLIQHLSKTREIIGDVSLNFMNVPINNLAFLKNLEEIRGYSSGGSGFSPGLKIYSNNLEYLGLKNLVKVYGQINIFMPRDNCYDNTVPWHEITVDRFTKPKCNSTCDELCTKGCWGPTNQMCYNCEYFTAGERCVKQCKDLPGYFRDSTLDTSTRRTCRKCHSLCGGSCSGPTAAECIGSCKYAEEKGKCVSKCSLDYYPNKSTNSSHMNCELCHKDCYSNIQELNKLNFTNSCTGSSNILGDGGCNMCEKAITTSNSINSTMLCYRGQCPNGFYKNTVLSNRIRQEAVCMPCLNLCRTCTAYSNHRNMCKVCRGFWSNDICVSNCPSVVRNFTGHLRPNAQCPQCHKQCKSTCDLSNDDLSCHKCINKKLYLHNSTSKFQCVSSCPLNRNYTELHNDETVCLSLEQTQQYRQRRLLLILMIGLCCVFGVVLIGICLVCKWRFQQNKIKAELKALYSNYKEQNLRNIKEESLLRPPNMNRLQMISTKDLEFDINDKPLGIGAFGKVFCGQWKAQGPDNKYYWLDVVVKVIHNATKESTDEFLEEAKIMASVSHRHCLPLIGVCLTLDRPCLITTFAKYGSLEKYLHKYPGRISSYHMLKWAEQIADGMAYLNLRGIIHRDLAARNILVCSKDTVQITDFGLARLLEDTQQQNITIKSGRVPIRWLALETLIHSVYSSQTDVWAYGVTLWEIFTYAQRPYDGIETKNIRNYLQEGNRLNIPNICSLEVYMHMLTCWLVDPDQRPSFQELILVFEKFSNNSRQYLCIPRENKMENQPNRDSLNNNGYNNGSNSICMQPQYLVNQSSGSVPFTMTTTTLVDENVSNGTDALPKPLHNNHNNKHNNNKIDNSTTANTNTTTTTTSISNSDVSEVHELFLPKRNPRRRHMTSSVLSNFSSKLNSLNAFLSRGNSNPNVCSSAYSTQNNNQQQNTLSSDNSYSSKRSRPYQISNNNNTNESKNWTSYDSQTALLQNPQRDVSPSIQNPRIADLKATSSGHRLPNKAIATASSASASSNHSLANSIDRIFIDQQISSSFNPPEISYDRSNNDADDAERDGDNEICPVPEQLLPIDINRIDGKDSLDSGNSHNFDADDYLLPTSRLHSTGYYNMTPSPPPTNQINPLAISNKILVPTDEKQTNDNGSMSSETLLATTTVDDGYLEPLKNPIA